MQGGDMNTMKKCSTCGTLYSGDLCSKCMAGFAQKSTDPTAPPEELPFKPGEIFHGLEILELIGRGGMGVVYKARQPALDRMVALKILPRKMALDPDFQNRFIREAKALGSLSHPNIVAVYDFGAEGGFFFFAMEYVDGTNLRQILRDRKLTPEQGLKIVPQLCDALEYAHGEGVVHRDIKPENILLDRKGRVKIADFGLAKLVGADAPVNITMTNMVMGTPHYMAPEQVENPKGVDHRADIYAIGVVLYEMLTGELPIGHFEMPSKKVQVDVRLDDVVLKALEKSPERRYQNAGDVKDAVTKATTVTSAESYSPTILTPKPAKKEGRRAILVMSAVTAAALLIATVALLRASTPQTAVPAPTVTPPPVAKVEAPETVDLATLYFSPEERPGGYVYQGVGPGLPRNPMPAKEPSEIETLIKALDDLGIPNVGVGDVKQGYLAAWFRWEVAFLALQSPIAEKIKLRFEEVRRLHNRWAYQKGPLLVLAWAPRKETRAPFAELVGLLQKKLGLPVETPDVPLEELRIEASDFPSDWLMEPLEIVGKKSGLKESQEVRGSSPDGKDEILVGTYSFDTAARAKEEEPRLADRFGKDSARAEVYRAGRTVLAFALRGRDVHAYERTARYFREYMGYPERSMDTIIPAPGELPAGYAYASVRTDSSAILKELDLTGVRSSDVIRAWHAVFKPQGAAYLLQLKDTDKYNALETQLRKRGPAWHYYGILTLIEGPDDVTLDALENRFREKFGYDANHPRPIHLLHARLKGAELPEGWSLGEERMDKTSYSAELGKNDQKARFLIQEFRDYQALGTRVAELSARPHTLVLSNNLVVAAVSGTGEESWPLLDSLEAVLRKKMRLGPAEAPDFALDGKMLPKGCVFVARQDLGFSPNPQETKGPEGMRFLRARLGADLPKVESGWAALVDPAEIQVYVLQFADEAEAKEQAKRIPSLPGSKQTEIFRKGPILGIVRSAKSGDPDAEFLAGELRAKLRAPRP